jgi:hypothetical protein
MKLRPKTHQLQGTFATFAMTAFSSAAVAAPCSEVPVARAVYGAGGSAVTPTIKNVATALAGLPEGETLTIFYHDPGACTGYGYFRSPDPTLEVSFRYWDATGTEATCEAGQDVIQFAHMGNTPAFCPGDVPLPEGTARFVAPVQTVNLITHIDSQYGEVSAEALYHVFGFGPGATGHTVVPWSDSTAVFVRKSSSFVHQLVARSIQVPDAGFQLPAENFLAANGDIVNAVDTWGDANNPDNTLGYVSGSNAVAGEDAGQIKSLAYQHFDQSCAYLPDSSRTRRDRVNVRSGQYWLWTPAWFYTAVGTSGEPVNADVAELIHWFDGSLAAPGDVDVQEIIVQSGDVPLCAMQAIRPDGDLSAIQSYAPGEPCNGWYEFVAVGSTDYQTCDQKSDCQGDDEECRYGFCEPY